MFNGVKVRYEPKTDKRIYCLWLIVSFTEYFSQAAWLTALPYSAVGVPSRAVFSAEFTASNNTCEV